MSVWKVAGQDSLAGRLISGTAWAFTGRIAAVLTALGLNALVTRLLTPAQVGAYFLVLSFVSVAAAISQLGLQQAVVQVVASAMGLGQPGRAKAAIRLALCWGGGGAVAVAALVAAFGPVLARTVFRSELIAGALDLGALWLVAIAVQGLLSQIFQAFHDIRLATVFGSLGANCFALVFFVALWRWQGHSDLNQLLALLILAGVAADVLGAFPLRAKLASLRSPAAGASSREILDGGVSSREILAIALPLLVTNAALLALAQADLWILAAFRPPQEVAIYGAASRMVILVVTPLLIVNAVVPPVIAELYAQQRLKELERALRATATVAGIPALVVLAAFIFLGGPVLGRIYGNFYRDGATVLVLLSLGQCVNVLSGSCGLTLIMTGHQSTMMSITTLVGIATVAMTLAVVNSYGLQGVAVAAATGLGIQNAAMCLAARIKTKIWTQMSVVELLTIMKGAVERI